MASVLSMYVLMLKGPYRRSILRYGPYKDHVRFLSQFPTADVEAVSEESSSPVGLCLDGVSKTDPASFLADGGAELLCRRHSGDCWSVEIVFKVRMAHGLPS